MQDEILNVLKKIITAYPEIVPLLNGKAAKIAEDGVEWHQNFEPYEGDNPGTIEPNDWVVTDADIDLAISAWDEAMPDYEGLLEAEVDDAG